MSLLFCRYLEIKISAVLPNHKYVIFQNGRVISGVFNFLFRTILPIGKAVAKSSPKIFKITVKSPLKTKLCKSSQKVALGTEKI